MYMHAVTREDKLVAASRKWRVLKGRSAYAKPRINSPRVRDDEEMAMCMRDAIISVAVKSLV